MENIVGSASAATLGYIWNNIPGAVYGYNAYQAYRASKAMPAVRRGRRTRPNKSYRRPTGSSWRILPRPPARMRKPAAMNTIVTRQSDHKGQYVRKRMPAYKKRPWKKFVKKITAVQLSNAATKTVVYNDKIVSDSTPGNQAFMSFCLYGINGADDDGTLACGYRDMLKLFDNEPDVKQEAVGAPAVFYPSNGKIHFNTGVLDFTIRNLSSDVDAEVDVYYGYHYKDANITNIFGQNTQTLAYSFLNVTTDPIKTGNTPIELTQRGTTPFDCSSVLSESGFKILKKQKLQISPSGSVFIQHRDSKNHILNQDDLSNIGYAKKKLTYEVLIVHKPSITISDETVSTIGVGITRKYGYSVLAPSNQAVSASNPVFDPAP